MISIGPWSCFIYFAQQTTVCTLRCHLFCGFSQIFHLRTPMGAQNRGSLLKFHLDHMERARVTRPCFLSESNIDFDVFDFFLYSVCSNTRNIRIRVLNGGLKNCSTVPSKSGALEWSSKMKDTRTEKWNSEWQSTYRSLGRLNSIFREVSQSDPLG